MSGQCGGHAVERPAAWLVAHAHLLPREGLVLDVACGRGRHAIWLAERGLHVHAVDRNAEAIAQLDAEARRRRLRLDAAVIDLETGEPSLGIDRFDAIVVTNYLHRPLFPALLAALRPGGVLVYETFTLDQAKRGKPSNPAFLLERGELRRLVQDLDVAASREGDRGERSLASIVAIKPHRPAHPTSRTEGPARAAHR